MPQLRINVPWPKKDGVVARINATIRCETDLSMCQAVGIGPYARPKPRSDKFSTMVHLAPNGDSDSASPKSAPAQESEYENEQSLESLDTERNREEALAMLDDKTGRKKSQLARDNTLAILEGRSDPIPQFDFEESPRRLQLDLIHQECQRNHRFARHFERLYERAQECDMLGQMLDAQLQLRRPRLPQHPTRLPQPRTPYTTPKTRGASMLRRSVLSALSEGARHELRGWEDKHLVMLFMVENDGPLYDRIVRVRNLNACTAEEYEAEMRTVASRGWRDIIWVLRHEDDFPREMRLARGGPNLCCKWGESVV